MEIVPNSASPFDAIKQTRPDGSEYWSARELMKLMGYSRWEYFKVPIDRAIQTAKNQGQSVETLFLRYQEKPLIGRPRENYELSRYAAYLVAMNGDPNMARVAETTPVKELTGAELMAKALIEAQNVLAKKDAHIAELEPAATSYDHWKQKDNGMSRRKLC